MFCYCAESRRAARLLTARYDAELAAAGLTSAQFELMQVIASSVRLHGRALAEFLAVDPATLSRNLKVLIAARWVRAQRDKADGRQTVYSLTPAGEKRVALARPLWQKAHRATLNEFGAGAEPLRHALEGMTHLLRG
jgi:DNA-binding MarR family transcriptional regulator